MLRRSRAPAARVFLRGNLLTLDGEPDALESGAR